MFTVDDIPNNDRISDPIEVTIVDISTPGGSKIDYELTIEDNDGNTVEMDIWTTHELEIHWKGSHRYELTNVRGRVWQKNGRRHAQLSSTKDLQATDLGPGTGNQTRVLIIGDSHVGYRNRKRANRVPAHRGVDCGASFDRAVELAINRSVDAFVHAGDVFDDDTQMGDITSVTSSIGRLEENGIPFYYILGNHESASGTKLLRSLDGCFHLSGSPSIITDSNIQLFGIDYHSPDEFPISPIRETETTSGNVNLLVVHQTFAPFRRDGIDLGAVLEATPIDFNAILSGHLHVAERGEINGVPVVYTGATERISKIGTPNNPSAWLLSVSGTSVTIGRQPFQ